MSTSKRIIIVFGSLAALFVVGASITWAAELLVPSLRQEKGLSACKAKSGEAQVDCVFDIIRKELKGYGVGAAMSTFALAYENFHDFVASGCHRHSHRVGDIIYYEYYLGKENLEAIEFPQITTACGYGFYHGFLEHLIQDRPDPEFVTEVCTYLTERLGKDMGDIEMTCYHGAGHGFVLAQFERVPKEEWRGEMRPFTDLPVAQCKMLKKASPTDFEQCLEGVFNVVADAMSDRQYGFSYDYERPLAVCDPLPQDEHEACYYEMAQKLDKPSGNDPERLSAIVLKAGDAQYRLMAFKVGVAGIVQQIIAEQDGYKELLAKCTALSGKFYDACLGSVVNGLYEHGEPQQEYKKALAACAEPSVIARDKEKFCFETVARRLPRFYPPKRVAEICAQFPSDFIGACTKAADSRDQNR